MHLNKFLLLLGVFALISCTNSVEQQGEDKRQIETIFLAEGTGDYLFRLDGRPVHNDSGYTVKMFNQRISGIVEYGIYQIYYKGSLLLSVDGNTRVTNFRGNYNKSGHHFIFVRNYDTAYVFINGIVVNLPSSFHGDIRLFEKDGLIILGRIDGKEWTYCVFYINKPNEFRIW